MEAAATGPAAAQRSQYLPPGPGIPGLDVVRALHQTVISLRTALDSSREELRRLKESEGPPETEESYDEAVGRLALENHVLRRRLLSRPGEFSNDAATSPPPEDQPVTVIEAEEQLAAKKMEAATGETTEPKTPNSGDEETAADSAQDVEPVEESNIRPPKSVSEGSLTTAAAADDGPLRKPASSEGKLSGQGVSNESENDSEELDDIELIFTTDETCRDVCLQEDLVSITDTENWQQQQQQRRTPTPNEPHKQLLKIGQAKSADGDVGAASGLVCNGGNNSNANSSSVAAEAEKSNSVDEAASSQSSSIDREESVDRFDESSSSRLNKMWSQCSVLVETDISKCGVLEEVDLNSVRHSARRNTLAAPPASYRPIIHREALAAGRRKSSAPLRPVMDRSSASSGARRESGAQTDISALPAQWRSESYLAHKVAHTFTTLPSKFALPVGVPGRLRLSDKTREARRVMLSDISFTSMVPELSRSADHLCHETHNQFGQPHCYGSRSGAGVPATGCAGLRTPEGNRRESWARGGTLPGSCDCRLSTDLYAARCYRGSLSSIPSPGGADLGASRRHSWRPNAAASFEAGCWRNSVVRASQNLSSGCSGGHLTRPTWSSMPSSPTHVPPPPAALVARMAGNQPRRTRSKVTFQECPMIRGSLPNLRSELLAENSGDSTESLIDEAEDYLRRSIDSMLTISTGAGSARHSARRRRTRRHSEPDLFRDWNPPQDARPYLPKIPRDLKLDHLVKVISPEGRILQGRVRYVGPVAGREDVHVGVQLPSDSGNSDGTFHGRRYFDCEQERAIFVPFKKVVLAWCTTT